MQKGWQHWNAITSMPEGSVVHACASPRGLVWTRGQCARRPCSSAMRNTALECSQDAGKYARLTLTDVSQDLI